MKISETQFLPGYLKAFFKRVYTWNQNRPPPFWKEVCMADGSSQDSHKRQKGFFFFLEKEEVLLAEMNREGGIMNVSPSYWTWNLLPSDWIWDYTDVRISNLHLLWAMCHPETSFQGREQRNLRKERKKELANQPQVVVKRMRPSVIIRWGERSWL